MSGYHFGPIGVLPPPPTNITVTVGGGGILLNNTGFGTGTFSFTGLNGGVNFPAGSVVVVNFANFGGAAPTSPTIGGQSATQIANDTARPLFVAYSIKVGGSSVADTFGFTIAAGYGGDTTCFAYYLTGASSPTPSSTLAGVAGGSDPQIVTGQPIVVPANGCGLTMFGCANPTASTTTLWGNPSGSITPDAAIQDGTNILLSYTSRTTAGNWNPGITGSNALSFRNNAIIVLAFAP
jgi:hypothetical protein